MTDGYNVEIRGGVWTVTYTEAAGSLCFSFELGIGSEILFFPSASAWEAKAPGWARARRAEILRRIEDAFGGNGCEAVEIESF